jgi:hypothetical protein
MGSSRPLPFPEGPSRDPADRPRPGPAGRDRSGRFAKGNKFGPGNPFARKVAGLRSALLRKIDEEHIERVADQLLAMALEGDLAAIKIVLLYTIGRPAEAVDPDDLDRLEFERHRANGAPLDDVREVLSRLFPLGLANDCLRHALPCLSDTLARQCAKVLRTGQVPAPPEPAEVEVEDDDESAAPPPAAPNAPPSPEPGPAPSPTPAPAVLPFSAGTVNKRGRRPGRAANRGRSAPGKQRRPRGSPSTNGGNGS